MTQYELTRQAHCDLEEAVDHLLRHSSEAGQRFIVRAVSIFSLIAAHPELGRRRTDLKVGLRSFPLGSHVVYYRIGQRTVQILRVLHGARDAQAALRFLVDTDES